MPIEVIKRDMELKCKPMNGKEAYNKLIGAIHREIDELQEMLDELSEPKAKDQFIKEWYPNVGAVTFYDNEEDVYGI